MDLQQMMEEERQRLNKQLAEIATRRVVIDQEEGAVHIELSAISGYFDAKMGKVMTRAKGKARGPRKVGVKQRVLDTITADGTTKQDIIAKLGAADDVAMKNAISNMLSILKKAGTIVSGERGSYKLPNATPTPPVESKPRRVPKTEPA